MAVTDLGGTVLAQTRHEIAIAEGPEAVLGWLEATFDGLLDEIGRGHDAVRGVGVGLPGPVEFATGRPVSPPIMPGWDRYPVGDRLATRYGVPALVDNDVNIMAVGEHWSTWRDEAFLLFVKMGTGIGSGIVAGGHVHRGADGAAGDIGHIHVPDHDDIVCRCGNRGCLEAFAGGGAMAARLREAGLETHTSLDVVDRVRAGHPVATQLIREAGRTVGGVLATCVNMLNPAVIVIGGDLARADEPLLAGVREVVYRRSLPLATGRLRIVPSRLDDEAGIVGAAVMVIESVLAPDAVDAAHGGLSDRVLHDLTPQQCPSPAPARRGAHWSGAPLSSLVHRQGGGVRWTRTADRRLLRQLAEGHVDGLLVAVAGEGDLDGVAGRLAAHGGGQAGGVGDLGVAHAGDDVALLEAGRRRRAGRPRRPGPARPIAVLAVGDAARRGRRG